MSEHTHPHSPSHDHGDDRGPVADASVRTAVPTDAPAVGVVQSAVWTQAYAGRVPDEVVSAFEAPAFAKAWRQSLENPPAGVHRLLVARAGEQVVGFLAIGPSQDPDAGPARGEVTAMGVHPGARRVGHGSRLLNAGIDHLRGAGAEDVAIWVLADDEATRAFLVGAGLGPDGAFRDRVVSPDGETLREVRLVASLTPPDGDDTAP
ncbi:ribosomal protein S18 acetylase RimI-like enzyme [Knoellia remsis]|uniref:Ribosomal protein S18 acetylase RimI-like enzyme n=1 Tax=Knoellia remsis TaxID=407159 RepID=A0A2T0V0B5_9MICO|nr:GNAT family N-acetyltransferase [Knoellia remsis]PRY63629.1 ribosomal protein S18 acetylase RimI-like enzyme [Knoellia remsis]